MSAGMNSPGRSTPLLGLAFLISAITALWPAAILPRKAPSKSRVSTRLSASARMISSGTFFRAAAISSRLTATIFSRMSAAISARQLPGQVHELLQLGSGRAGLERLARLCHARRDRVAHVGRIQGGARIEHDDVARRA